MTALVESTKHPLLHRAICELYGTTGEGHVPDDSKPWEPGRRITDDPALQNTPYTGDEINRAEAALATMTEEDRHLFAVGDEEDAKQFETRGPDFKLASDILVSCFAEY